MNLYDVDADISTEFTTPKVNGENVTVHSSKDADVVTPEGTSVAYEPAYNASFKDGIRYVQGMSGGYTGQVFEVVPVWVLYLFSGACIMLILCVLIYLLKKGN